MGIRDRFMLTNIIYSSKELYIILWVNYPVVGEVPMYLMVDPLFLWNPGQFIVITNLPHLHVSLT